MSTVKDKKRNIFFLSSVRVSLIAIMDMLLMAVSFFLTYLFVNTYEHLGKSAGQVYLGVAIYVILFFASICLLGGYLKKNLSQLSKSVIITISSAIISHVICYIIFKLLDFTFLYGIVVSGAISCFLIIISRTVQKILYKEYIYKYSVEGKIHTLIIGAGFTGKMVYRELTESQDSEYVPVCFVDDNKELVAQQVCGLNVYSPTILIPQLCKKYNVGLIVFAIPSCSDERRSQILSNCVDIDCDVRIVPSLSELTSNRKFFLQSNSINIEKLLGRDEINIENNKVQTFINGKVCLVTGGGGSIGSELCRQIVKMNPEKLVVLDIYENNAYEIQQELKIAGYGEDKVIIEIASVRDADKIRVLFEKYRFDVIFHAAAHKHVPLMETSPEEAVKNNVVGTYNVAHMAQKFGAEKMILISTDKAVNPTNVMGASKRVCEMVMSYMAHKHKGTKFAAVRFGNVLGSNGSVIPLFVKQIETGGPVTVTHPDIIRYFMTIPEAVSLVLEAGTMSQSGETFVLDMGEPVKILNLAENLIRMYGYEPYVDMLIEFSGLRKGEKLFEELLMAEENLKETYNKKIFISNQLDIDITSFMEDLNELVQYAKKDDSSMVINMLHKIVPNFKSPAVVNSNALLAK